MKNLKSLNLKFLRTALFLIIFISPQAVFAQDGIWPIRSVDTMKTSRDKARAELFNPGYDREIEFQIKKIKELGANYVALGTPYDGEFLPYLKRWIKIARANDLSIYFRGNWSNYEGWFEYPKNLTPENHTKRTVNFIQSHPELFADGDIFDPCPECENAGYFIQPQGDLNYNQFLINQHQELEKAFKKINKKVVTNIFSLIGGRAKESLNEDTIKSLGSITTIDHYTNSVKNMQEYINYFRSRNSKVVLGEFGAPIPDIHGVMSEDTQSKFIGELMQVFYQNNSDIAGLNYYVLSEGTTALVNDDGSERKVTEVIKKYFKPGVVNGSIKNNLNDGIGNVEVKTKDGFSKTKTDFYGNFKLIIPAGETEIIFGGNEYSETSKKYLLTTDQSISEKITLEPVNKNLTYRIREFIRDKLHW